MSLGLGVFSLVSNERVPTNDNVVVHAKTIKGGLSICLNEFKHMVEPPFRPPD